MNFAEREGSKRYCIQTKHVAILCAVVVGVGLIVGLAVGLTRSCDSGGDGGPGTAPAPSHLPSSTASPSGPPAQDQDICPASEDESGQWKNFRLPDFVNPVHYDLHVKPLLEEDTYTGTVSISINLSAPTRYLWLHLRETRITRLPELKRPSGNQVQVRRCFEYKKQEYVVVEAEEELTPSSGDSLYLLTMEFAGWLNGSLVGFYRTTYTENGQVKSIAATDHEPTDARKSFPCFDEPNKKATYTISITHPKEYEALSNMPVAKEESVDDKWTRTTFEKSVPMSTYLVCFAVHQFHSVKRISNSGKPLTIYVQPEQKHTAEYAANITKSVFDYFEEYFAMNYSLPKLDKIAIPDFGTGAMENWGLITYRETNLLYDPEESASSNQQRVATVVAHELVHQWFGNIVTMDWWEDLWLNEGFASFFEFLGVNHAETDWQMRDQMLLEDVLPVQEDDSLMSSHPIVVTVTTPDEITSVFDGISYSKGASILRMLEDWIKPENFQKGCQMYLEKYQFKNAKTSDFWAALEEASRLPVKEVMDTWTRQMGYPVLNVNGGKNITQKRFLLDSRANPSQPPSDLGYTWNVPVKWTEDNITSSVLFNRSEKEGITLNSSNPSGNALLKINPDHIGFYRVNYEVATWDSIAAELSLNHKTFSSADRASLIDDAFALASLPVNLRLLVYRYGMQNSGNEISWNYTLEQYQKTSLAQEKEKLLYGLASVKNVTLLSRYLDLLKDTNLIKTQDVFTVIRYISYNSYGKNMAWNWIQLNWDYLVNRFTLNNRNLGRIVTIAEPFNTELQLWQMESFFAKYPQAGAGEKPRQQVLETVKNNIEWLKQHRNTIREWFLNLLESG
ncbi:glutamyl aminopeptidase isoform X2 [Papio anubis]|uniref:glutamyl aminopeptidase isoform X2 n=1 Tax=Papio anubis TaxID=9555 RepID=UPI0012AD6C6D|nr:glutamyl aminopeptidase isoform X2 [Papio anubis]